MMKRIVVVLASIFVLLAVAMPGSAASITYTFSGTGTGDLNGVPFTDTAFTITSQANTGSINPACFTGVYCVRSNPATIAIAGFGPATFTTATEVFDNISGVLGFERWFDMPDLLDLSNPAFVTYNLATSIGPIFVPTPFSVNQWNCSDGCVNTTQGILNFSAISNVTFTASTGPAVPEPATLTLLGLGYLAVGAARRLRRRV